MGEQDLYDLAPDPDEPAPRRPPPAIPVTPSPPSRPTAPPPTHHSAIQEESPASPLKHVYLPIVLLVAGLAIWMGQAVLAPLKPSRPLAWSVALALFMLVINLAIMLIGIYASARLLGVNFGPVRSAVLKLAAAAVFAGGVGAAIASIDPQGIRGLVIAWHAIIVIYWLLFYLFFELDLQETLMTVVVIGLMQGGGMCVLWRA